MPLTITAIDVREFTYTLQDVGTNPEGYNLVFEPGTEHERTTYGLRIQTDAGVTGEYVGGNPPAMAQLDMVAGYLVGRNPLAREKHWAELRRALRKYDQVGIGPIDIALWDLAGKHYDAPIHELLGTYRDRLPAYASTYFGREDAGFDSPEAYADFAETCRDRGFPAFKLHTWSGGERTDIDREVETIHVVADRVGLEMGLMHDPVCEYETFADALTVGRALDERGFRWYEDPYSDGGRSQHGHRRLRDRLDTPLLATELVRGLEPHTDFIASEATDFVRADVEWDGGITGAMKIARVAEGFGVDVEYHLSGPAQRHCMAATRNSNYYELGLIHPNSPIPHTQPPVYGGGYSDAVDDLEDGAVPVPSGAGLGVEYDWDYIDDHTQDEWTYQR